jgi:ureidoglycolate lyase
MLNAEPLSAKAFAPYGDVIETSQNSMAAMNEARFERFDDLAKINVDGSNDGHVAISIAVAKVPVELPYRFELVERHPLGSQAFIPLNEFAFTVVVAPFGESVDAADLRAFTTNGRQGINYHRGVWHMPLIATEAGQEFLIVDRAPSIDNVQVLALGQPITLII